ncbi:O-linked N-acetylglucosamine transferase family protein [Aerosakkonema funiforme]|uniref:protein O-GlcNAc transferase n=1 Tax=Aerosakkonema funiforme FACHB-1375 TaxID=2949571 RepID=A0A926VE30_9CYAN|nr:tetratricopeptide repeat protein [Aerosakkonema funiforme]MBD2181578.1 tetratricopeptide repeat protein [Aerosakkonema funiforme FACHB-1375]
MSNSTGLHQEALAWHNQKCFVQAEQKYKEALQFNPNNPDIWSDLSVLYYQLDRYQEGLEAIDRALNIGSPKQIYYYRLGLLLEKTGAISRSIRAYQQSIVLDNNWIDSYVNLGRILFEQGNLSKAESVFMQAIARQVNRADIYYYLGKVLIARRQVESGIAAYKKALSIENDNFNILYDLGTALQSQAKPEAIGLLYIGHAFYYQNNYAQAVKYYEDFLAISQENPINVQPILEAYFNLITSLYQLEQDEEAIKAYREAIQTYPNVDRLPAQLWEFLHLDGRAKEAIKIAELLPNFNKNNLYLLRQSSLILPVVYESEEEIDYYRDRFTQGLEELIEQTSLTTPETIKNALMDVGAHTNFYLAYQGKNDLKLQTRYGQYFQQIMAANYPEFVKDIAMPTISEHSKINIGYISNYFYSYHTVTHLFLGWLRHCDRHKFNLYCYQLGNPSDLEIVKFLEHYSDNFYHLAHDQSLDINYIRKTAEKIISDRLHVLVFLDIGMHPYMTVFGSLRLAPIQCSTWAHPVTTGLPTIDYFLSSDLMEPYDAENHYSEKLIRLPNIGISYPKTAIPKVTKTRKDYQLREDAIVYLCCQSLYKYLPQYDYIFTEIAKRIPQAQFAFISNKSVHVTKLFRQRLQRAFERVELNSEDYCKILPQQYQIDYWNLNLISDIFLDTLSWSGGRTTLEAITCNLPIVTCPSEFMRGRHSYAILKMLGMTETIAKDETEYIEIAVRLGLDRSWRESIVKKMNQRHSYLYNDKTCVAALEEFYQQVVREKYQLSKEQ